jgi:uncharacterized protein YkwD
MRLSAIAVVFTPLLTCPPVTAQKVPPAEALQEDWLYARCLKAQFPEIERSFDDHKRAYDPASGRNFAYEDGKWIDIKTGQNVCPKKPPPAEALQEDWLYARCLKAQFPEIERSFDDHKRAYDPASGRNFAYEDGKWIDIKTGEAVCPRKQNPKTATCPPAEKKAADGSVKTIGLVPPAPTDPTAAGLLAYHNKLRADVGSPPLQWDPVLADHALGHARTIADTGQPVHSARAGRKAERENVSLGMRGLSNPLQLAQVWGAEQRNFRAGVFPDISTTDDWSDAGHYSQMVWSETTEVGCGFARGRRADALVCRYLPPGNQDGEPVIRIGLTYEFAGQPCAPTYQETNVPRPELPNKETFEQKAPEKLDDPL